MRRSDLVKALVEGSAETSAKWLNSFGMSAEYAPELKLGVAISAILGARQMLLSELKKMAAEVKADKDKDEKEKAAAAKAATPLSILEKQA